MKHAIEKWIGSYLKQCLGGWATGGESRVKTAYLAIADHYEPFYGQPSLETALDRLAAWEQGWPGVVRDIYDSRGKHPQHTFFYPLEDYRPDVLDRLARLCQNNGDPVGDIEVHLHHEGESSAQLEDLFSDYAETLYHKHGLLRLDPISQKPAYGFIHGNWALDNSRPDGRWCGVNDELQILNRTGCYADFTMPSAPDRCQTATINSIYYAVDDPEQPKSHNHGIAAQVGKKPSGDLLMVQGVLALNWGWRKYGIFPHLENSDLGGHQMPKPERALIWRNFAPVVKGAEQYGFIKLHCHGAVERHHDALMGEPMRDLLIYLAESCPEQMGCEFRFVTCWEMVQKIHALERGEEIE